MYETIKATLDMTDDGAALVDTAQSVNKSTFTHTYQILDSQPGH